MSYIDDFASNTFPSQTQMITRRYLAFYFPLDPNYLSINLYESNNIDNGIFRIFPIYIITVYIYIYIPIYIYSYIYIYPYKSLYIHAYFQ
jgi:hypothetical protein